MGDCSYRGKGKQESSFNFLVLASTVLIKTTLDRMFISIDRINIFLYIEGLSFFFVCQTTREIQASCDERFCRFVSNTYFNGAKGDVGHTHTHVPHYQFNTMAGLFLFVFSSSHCMMIGMYDSLKVETTII